MSAAPESALPPALSPACGSAGAVAALSGPRAARLPDLSLSESFERALSPNRSTCSDAMVTHEQKRKVHRAAKRPSPTTAHHLVPDSKHQVYFLNFSGRFHGNVFVLK